MIQAPSFRTIGFVALVGGVAYLTYTLTRPKGSLPGADIGVRIDEAVIVNPGRLIQPGEGVNVTVRWTNITDNWTVERNGSTPMSLAPRFRLAIQDGRTPIEGDWVRSVTIAPGESGEVSRVMMAVPMNWRGAVSVFLHLEGVGGVVRSWPAYFDIAVPEAAWLTGTEIVYGV